MSTQDLRLAIISSETNDVLSPVYFGLEKKGFSVSVIDPSEPGRHKVSISSVDGVASIVDEGGRRVDINSHTRVWLRRPRMPSLSSFRAVSESVADFELKTYRAAWESLYSIKAAWMNPYSSSRPLERDKLLQARIAGDAGLLTVPTIFTNNPEEYSLFVASLQGDDVAVKAPISWHSDVVGSETPYGTYTRRLAQADALRLSSRVARSPVLVQPYVEKSYELRITVVGERIFACRIDSQKSPRAKVDWRHYDTASVPHDAVQIDTGVERALFEFMHRAGLVFAAIDMIVEPNGDHRFLEANPSGQFSWIEALTGLTITAGIVDWLSGA